MAHFRRWRNGPDQAENEPLLIFEKVYPPRVAACNCMRAPRQPATFRAGRVCCAVRLSSSERAAPHRESLPPRCEPLLGTPTARALAQPKCDLAAVRLRPKAILAVTAAARWQPSHRHGGRSLSGWLELSTAGSRGALDRYKFDPVWRASLNPCLQVANHCLTTHWISCYLWD